MKLIRVLMVEDDPDIVDSVVSDLQKYDNYEICSAADAKLALSFLKEFDVILLDIMLPDQNGVELCGKLRRRYSCPIIFISCLDDSTTIIEALGKGGDDYVVKPFDNHVLHARILANLRRVQMERGMHTQEGIITCGDLDFDVDNRIVWKGNRKISLLPIEASILQFLIRNPGRYYKAKEIYQEVWRQDSAGDIRTVIVHMHNLRSKIEDDMENPCYIQNVWGKGYTFCVRENGNE